jgi:phage tail-like protein
LFTPGCTTFLYRARKEAAVSSNAINTTPTLRPDNVKDPLHEYQFVFVLGIEPVALVSEVSGLSQERDVIEHKIVLPTFTPYTQMIPGRPSWGRVTLKKALTADMSLWLWYTSFDVPLMSLATSKIFCTIVMYNRKYEAVTAWNLLNAWPSKITGPSFKTESNAFAFEELELVHEGITRVPMSLA